MMSSTMTADPGLGSISNGHSHTGSNALLSVVGEGMFSSLVLASSFVRFFFITSVADSICSFEHSYSASLPFLHLDSYSLSHFISILDTMATKAACVFVAPIGIELKCIVPLGMKNAVFFFKAWFIFTCQYPASRSAVI